MISYLQDLLQRRGKPIFLILLAVIIVAFVFVIGEQPGIVTGDRRGQEGPRIFGYNFQNERDPAVQSLIADTQLSFMLREGRPIFSEQEFEQEILMRAAYLEMMERYRIPRPDSATIRSHVESLPIFLASDGVFDRQRFNQFLDMQMVTAAGGEERMARVLEEDWRIQRLRLSMINPGLVRSVETLAFARQEQTQWTIQVARMPLNSLEIAVETSPEAVETYFSRHRDRYQRSEQLRTLKAHLAAEQFADEVEAPDIEMIQAWLERQPEHFDEDELQTFYGASAPKDHPLWEPIVARWSEARQIEIANQKANDFAFTLYDEEIPLHSPAFKDLVERYRVELSPLELFSPESNPSEIGLPRRTMERAFRLDENRYFSDPFKTDEGVAVLLLEERLPAHIPPLDEIFEEVRKDYEAEETRLRFAEEGESLRAKLRQSLIEGASFDETAEGLGFRVMSDFESFTVVNPPATLPRHIVFQLPSMSQGDISPFRIVGDEGFVTFVKEKSVPEFEEENRAALSQARQQLAGLSERQVKASFITEILRRELEGEDRR